MASINDRALFDEHALDEIKEMEESGEPSLVRELLLDFRQGAQSLIQQISASLAAGSQNETERAAHSLKSSSRLVGAMRLSDLAEAMEESARDGKLHECRAPLESAQAVLSETLKAMPL